MCWFLKASNPTMFSINYFSFIPLKQIVSFLLPYMVHHTWLFNLTSSYCLLLALLLVGGLSHLSHLCIFYHNCKGWSKHSSWSCWIPLVAWLRRDISGELNHLWILSWCHMNLQHQAKTISSDTDAFQEEMISLRHNLHHNNYLECIKSAPRNLDRRIEDNAQKLTTVCLSYVKWLAERIQKVCHKNLIQDHCWSGGMWKHYFFHIN